MTRVEEGPRRVDLRSQTRFNTEFCLWGCRFSFVTVSTLDPTVCPGRSKWRSVLTLTHTYSHVLTLSHTPSHTYVYTHSCTPTHMYVY